MNTKPQPKKQVARALLATMLAVGAFASARPGGIGGTGITAFGVVQAFGSIYVNGREFALGPATGVTIDGAPATTRDLRLGDTVIVSGTIDRHAHAQTQQVRVRHALIGMIEKQGSGELIIMGQRVRLNPRTRIVDAAGHALAVGDLRSGQMVAVSALQDREGIYRATRVALRPLRPASFLLRGTARALGPTRIEVAGQPLRVGHHLTRELEGRRVRVTGHLNGGRPYVDAVVPERALAAVPGERIEFAGFVQGRPGQEWRAREPGLTFILPNRTPAPDEPVALEGVERPDGIVTVGRATLNVDPLRVELPDARSGSDRSPAVPERGRERPEVERPSVQRPEIERPEIERPQIERPEIERPEGMDG